MQTIDIQTLKPLSFTIPAVSTTLELKDYLGTIKVRWGIGRDSYSVKPGLYKIGNPTNESDVFVSANYKLSFDLLRKNLDQLNAWILVIDTKGVNVWCAAGKKTFSTDNIVKSIAKTSLNEIVKHRKIILPQLGAPGVAAHEVKAQTGFRVIYGPIKAADIKAFIQNGYKANPQMRKVIFPITERAKLIPVDFLYNKYKLLITIGIAFVLSGLDRTGFLFSKMFETSLYPILNAAIAYTAGVAVAPLLLPFIPFRTFALKGAFWGVVASIVINLFYHVSMLETIAIVFLNVATASFLAMNFTGSSTYTSLSGVQKEMKWAVPVQIAFTVISIVLFIISKLV